ncbi:hypothetical protein [Flavobacterium sp. FlaQc-48]|uniref:hypothetical protein n=1 Tax=Flavobacterium sp. FlaQc-48 TaxID=3374181 RepID=UPI003756C76F
MKKKSLIFLAASFLILAVGCEKKTTINETTASASSSGTEIKMDGELPSKESIKEVK